MTDEGVIATDPIGVEEAKAYRAAIAEITDQPVKYVAYSHSHWDHVTGAQIFKDEGAQIVAQENCADNMRQAPHPDVVPPDITFADTYSIELGGRALDLYHFGPSHDTCMVVMVPRPANMLFVVDIGSAPEGFVMEYNPTMAEGYLHNMVPYLKAVEELMAENGIDTIISGHISLAFDEDGRTGAGPSTGPAESISEKRRFWEVLIGFVDEDVANATHVDDGAEAVLDDPDFARDMIAPLGPTYNESEMRILLRRVAEYIRTGR